MKTEHNAGTRKELEVPDTNVEDARFDRETVLRTARRSGRVYRKLLCGDAHTVDLSKLSDLTLAMVQEMLPEMCEGCDAMNLFNALLNIDVEMTWRSDVLPILPQLHRLLDLGEFVGTATELADRLLLQNEENLPTDWLVSADQLERVLPIFADRLRTAGVHVSVEEGCESDLIRISKATT